jgi:hypothetical protein
MKSTKILLVVAVLFLLSELFQPSVPGTQTSPPTSVTSSRTSSQTRRHSDCQAGMIPNGDYYSQENGQGVCNARRYVHNLGHQYEITGGIGM